MGIRGSKLLSKQSQFGNRRFKRLLEAGPNLTTNSSLPPKGYVPVCVGFNEETSKRFIVHRKALADACFSELLSKSAEEYGFCNDGVLRIACEESYFEECVVARGKLKILRG